MESQIMNVIRIWAAMAWADGVIAPAEAQALRKLVAAAGLPESERVTALGFLDHHVELDLDLVVGLSPTAREGVYQAAVRMAAVDLELADSERALLDHLRAGLAISADRAREIEALVLNG